MLRGINLRKSIKKSISVTLVFLVFINTLCFLNPLDKANASSSDEDKYMYSSSNSRLVNYPLSPTAEIASFKTIPSSETGLDKNMMLMNNAEASAEIISLTESASNLVGNGDFEVNPAENGSWTAYNNTTYGQADFIWNPNIYHGNESIGASMCITGSAISSEIINEVPIQPGKSYFFSAWGKADSIIASENEAGSFIYLCQNDESGNQISGSVHTFTDDGTFDWNEASVNFTAESNASSLIIMLGLSGSGTVWYDDVSLTEVAQTIPVEGITLNNSSLTMNVGDTNQLTGTISPDNATNKEILWSIESGSDVVSITTSGAIEALKPGIAVVKATSAADATMYSKCSISVGDSISLPANAVITDSVIDPSKPIIYITDKTNKKLYSVNYETKQIAEMIFADPPESIAFSDNEIYVALLKGEHDYYWWTEDQNGAIAVIDANNFTLKEQFDINLDPSKVVVGRDGYVYVVSGSGQWTNINSYSISTKQFTGSASIRQESSAELHPNYDRIYTINYDGSVVINTFDISNGIIQNGVWANDVGSDNVSGKFRVSPDGKYMFNSSGLILHCDIDKTKDMKYAFMLNKSFTDVSFDLANNKFFTVVPGKLIYSYDYNTFNGISTYSSTGEIKNLYYRDNNLIALSKTDSNQYIVEKIDTSSGSNVPPATVTTRQLQKNGNTFGLDYSINDSVMHPLNNIVYITDSINNKIASINYETGEAKELSTFYSPGSIAYNNNELYIGYGNQGKIEIYDAQTLALKDVIYTGVNFFDLNIGNDGYIYTTSGSFSRTSKQCVSQFGVFGNGYIEIHPTLNLLYTSSMGVSPTDLFALNYSNTTMISQYDSPYHGDYSITPNNKISPDGKFIFNGSGNIFTSSIDKSKDMNYYTKLNNAFSDVVFDIENNKFYTGVSGNSIYAYNYSTFEQINTYPTQGAVKKLYLRDGKLIAVSGSSQGKDIIEFIDTTPSTNAPGVINNVLINQTSASSCTITWDTEELTSSQVEYGLTQSYGNITGIDSTQVSNHSMVINNLNPNTTYHFKLHSTSGTINIVSNDITFITGDLPSIDLGVSINRIIYDTLSNKAYAIDNVHMKLMIIDLEKHILEKTILLSTKPDDLCLSEDSSKLYIVNFDGTVSEFSTEPLSKVRDIESSLPKYDSTNSHFHIKCKSDKLYLVDGTWVPALWSMDLNSLSMTQESNVNGIGDMVFSKKSDNFYSWCQFGWSAGWAVSYISKYAVGSTNITSIGTSTSDYPTMSRDPLDSPIMLIDEQNKLLTKNKVFDTNNFTELNTFAEDIYAVSLDGTFAAGKNGVYKLSDYQKAADTLKNGSDMMFFDNNRDLYYVVNEQSRIYYDNTFTTIIDPGKQVTGISLNKASTTKEVGSTEQLTATVLPENASNKNVVWSIQSGSDVVSVSTTGLITALKSGTAVVRVTSVADTTKYTECSVTVNVPVITVDSIGLNKNSSTIEVGSTEQITATVLPGNATNKNVVWSIQSGSDVVSLSTTGLITAQKSGSAVVRVTSVADATKYAECRVTVTPKTKAPLLTGFTWAKGSVVGTTKATVVTVGTLKYVVGATGSQVQPDVGDATTSYTNTIIANTDIIVTTGQHIFIVSVGLDGKITGWVDVAVNTVDINDTEVISPPPGGGPPPPLGDSVGMPPPPPPPVLPQTGAEPKNGFLTVVPVVTNNIAKAEIGLEDYKALLDSAKVKNGIKKLTIDIDNNKSSEFNTKLPASELSNSIKDSTTTINTSIAKVEVPSNMFNGTSVKGGSDIAINIATVDKSALPTAVAETIGKAPVIDISVTMNGAVKAWSNPNAPVTISLPYTLKDGESGSNITVYYIDGTGKLENMQGVYNSETKLVTFTTTHFSKYFVKENKVSYTDLAGYEQYTKYIEGMASKGIIDGVGLNQYSPEKVLTRAEFATLLVKMLKLDTTNVKNVFTDVKASGWYTPYVNAAYKAGLINGIGAGKFAPNEVITNQDAALILVKALKYKGSEITAGSLSKVKDMKTISKYALDSVGFAVSKGVISLDANGDFNAKSTVNRATAAEYIYNVFYFEN